MTPALPGGDVVSRHRLTYHGQPAEDAAISVLGEPGQIRVVVFGSSAHPDGSPAWPDTESGNMRTSTNASVW